MGERWVANVKVYIGGLGGDCLDGFRAPVLPASHFRRERKGGRALFVLFIIF